MDEQHLTRCVYCHHEIAPQAKFCGHCRHYVHFLCSIRNLLPNLTAIVAVVAGFISIYLYFRTQAKADVAGRTGTISCEIITVNSDGDIAIRNTGERNLFFTDVVCESDVVTVYRFIDRPLVAGELGAFPPNPSILKSNEWRCVTGEKAKAVREGKTLRNLSYRWYSERHPGLTAHFNFEDHLVSDGKITIYYYALGDAMQRQSVTVPCKVIAVQYSDARGDFSDEIIATPTVLEEGSRGSPIPPPPAPNQRRVIPRR